MIDIYDTHAIEQLNNDLHALAPVKQFRILITTRYYKDVYLDARDYEHACDLAYKYMSENDVLHNADVDCELSEVEELCSIE